MLRRCRESWLKAVAEFPSVHPEVGGHRYLYMGAARDTGNAPLQAILKIDLESVEQQLWSAAPRGFVSEPIFVPILKKKKTMAGSWLWFTTPLITAQIVILDARDLSRELFWLHLKHLWSAW